MECSAKTPARISEETYSIPIYQRLFTWTPTEINKLLVDLYSSYKKKPEEHYYIGLLTATEKDELVDGQQRFTVLTLMAIAMKEKYSEWNNFLMVNNKLRISFTARPDDAKYLEALILGDNDYKSPNEYMKAGKETIESFLESKKDVNNFCKYVYEHVAFFIQVLPEGYSGKMLNKYFESMNSTGRNLENHEILKVKLIEDAKVEDNSEEYDRLISMWNQASRMGQTIFPMTEEKVNRYPDIINKIKDGSFIWNRTDESEHSCSILDVIEKTENGTFTKKYVKNNRHSNMRSFLKFTDFLLLVLFMKLEDKKISIPNKSVFFNPENLRKTFDDYSNYFTPVEFIEDLFIYRIILDWAIIRVDDTYDYNLALTNSELSKLQQYEAMLYASTSRDTYYEWIPVILRYVRKYGDNEDSLLQELKKNDTINNPFIIVENGISRAYEQSDFKYRRIKRYFYRRLDYYLWERIVHENTSNEMLDIKLQPEEWNHLKAAVSSYKFHSYNSEEHLYPQNDDKQDVNNKWVTEDGKKDVESLNSFGNLVLISSPFNSSQGYDALDRKFGSIRDQIKQKKIESIKMAIMYYSAEGKGENWTAGPNGTSTRHGELMFHFLEKTY